MDHPSPISNALRLARSQGRALLDIDYGKDGDFVIFDAVSHTLRCQYPPFDRSLGIILNDMELVCSEDPSPQTRFIAARLRNAIKLIGTMVASNEIQGFGNKSSVIEGAKHTIRDELLLASTTYSDRPNLMPEIDANEATKIAEAIAQRMADRITEMRSAATQARGI